LRAIEQFLASLTEDGLDARAEKAAFASHLSARETEVLRLLATGKSNLQIAEALVISPNTVAKHVTSILDKTGAANRTEAAAYAHGHGLL
jgi:DNA-binding NarL/FixJ family response regulator